MRQLSLWLRAYRLPAQLNLIFPMLLGLYRHAPCDASLADLPLWEALGLSLLLQWVIMTSNEASDATTDDPRARTLISGGAGVGATGELSPRSMRRAALAGGMLGIGVTFALGGPGLVLVWLGAMLLIWAYDGPLRWSRSPVGSLCQAVGVGIVLPLLAGGLVAPLSMPTGVDCLLGVLLGFSGHILTALPDEQADRLVGKNTLVVWLGTGPARALMLVGEHWRLLLAPAPAARCARRCGLGPLRWRGSRRRHAFDRSCGDSLRTTTKAIVGGARGLPLADGQRVDAPVGVMDQSGLLTAVLPKVMRPRHRPIFALESGQTTLLE
ncbi:MAG: UbiA family prenyltransferase [Rhodocyclaceae bacterium]|nr:UbiA family prenyltransferase [Rhodocyclaceae bacterium]